MPSKVQIDLVAVDNASATLDSVRRQLEMFPTFARAAGAVGPEIDRTSRSFDGLDLSASKAARGIRSLAGPILGELSPALGQMGSQLAGVISTAAVLGSGMGALAIGASALAGLVGGKLVTAWQESRQEFEQFTRVMESGDLTRVTGQVDALSQKIVTLSEDIREARKAAGDPNSLTAGFFGDTAQDVLGLFGLDRRSRLGSALDQSAEARALREKLRDVEVPGGTTAELNRLLGANAQTTFATQQGQRGLYDFTLPGAESSLAAALRQADDLEAAGQSAAAANLRAAARAQFGRTQEITGAKLFGRSTPGAVSDYEGDFFGEGGQGVARELTERLRARDREREMELLRNRGEALGEDAVSDYAGQPFGTQGRAEAAAAIQQTTTNELNRQLEITQQLAILNATRTDVTLEQREGLSLQAIEHERILKLQIAGNDQAKIFGANIEAQLKRQQVLEATDPVAGLKRGIADLEVAWGSAGLRMQTIARDMGGGISTALADSMFGPLEERMKGLPPLFKSILTAMARAVTDDLGRALAAQLLGGVKALLPGGGAPGSSFFGEGAGSGGGPPGSGGVTNVYLTTSGRPLAQSEIDAAYAAGGDAGVRALRSGEATVVGGQFIPEYGDITLGGAHAPLPQSGPSLFQRSLPVAGNAAALGLTAYGATQNTSDLGTGLSAGLGALTGAGLGASLARGFPSLGLSSGYGAAGGALAGAAITGTIAALAKQEADKRAKKERQAAEVARAAGAGSDLVSSANQAQSPADLLRRITAFGSGSTGGSANPAVPVSVMTETGEKPIGVPGFGQDVATFQEFLAAPESLRAGIQAGVNPDLLAGPNAATSAALQAIATDLVAQFREAEQGVGLTQEDQVGGLTRRTTYPASRADMLAANLPVEIDELALQALSEDDRAATLLDVLGRVAVEQDIQSTISDGATGAIVSITRMARSTIMLPPGTGTVPAPVTPSGPPAAPGPSTAEQATAGGLLALGVVSQLADANSLLNQLLPTGYTAADLVSLITQALSGSAPVAAGGVLSGVAPEAVRDALAASGQSATTVGFQDGGLGFGDLFAGLGAVGGVVSLLQGVEAEDPASIIQGVATIYSSLATLANSALGTTLPTIGTALSQAASALGITGAGAAGSGVAGGIATGVGSGAAVGVEGGVVAATGASAALLPLAMIVGPYLLAQLTMALQSHFVDKPDMQALASRFRELSTSIPGHVANWQKAPGLLQQIIATNDPQEAARLYGELWRIQEEFQSSGMEAFLKAGGTRIVGGASQSPEGISFLPFEQGPAILEFLRPYGQALHYGQLLAQDKAARGGVSVMGGGQSAASYALGMGGPAFNEAYRPAALLHAGQPGQGDLLRLLGLSIPGQATQDVDPAAPASPSVLAFLSRFTPGFSDPARHFTNQDIQNWLGGGGADTMNTINSFLTADAGFGAIDPRISAQLNAIPQQSGTMERALRALLAQGGWQSDNPYFRLMAGGA